MLYLIPTPIGNLEDITLRALRLLQEVDLILAEDTRTSKKLLSHYEIDTPLRSYHAHNEHAVVASIIQLLESGQTLALITDAGTPGISDPGFLLTRECIKANITVQCLPGATAFVPALAASGLPCDKFFFEGFLPHKKGRQTRLKYLSELPYTFVLYESPHRLVKCLKQLIEFCGEERKASVSRELTKIHEECVTKSLADLVKYFDTEKKVRGEIVVVVEGKNK
ncbi:MAG TPA: 16S rRNA (cytidine(1402)-2'-O)-methyltransferase [Phaeodactylibacter sp.]|nr:16S rRNA (cytidine(1402)-2'-O)-methyltransferase [Phaeodactylibacter sp.]